MKKILQIIKLILPVGIVFVAALALLYISVCESVRRSTSDNTETVSEKAAPLIYYTWDDEESYIDPMVRSFNSCNPDITVTVHYLSSDDYDKSIISMVRSGQSIDLIGIRGNSQLARYHTEKMLADITSDIRNSDIDATAYGNMYNNITINGKYYAMPTRSTCWALLYNKDIFDARGIDYPGQLTWDEYGALAKKLKGTDSNGETVWGGYIATWAFNFAGIQNSNYLYDDDQTYQRKSLELLNQFMNIDKSHEPVQEMISSGESWIDVFMDGQAAMMPMGEWAAGMIMSREEACNSDINWDYAPMPIFKGMNPDTTWGQYQYTGITSTCKNTDAAFRFLKFVSGEQGAEIYAEHGMLSAYNTETIQDDYKNTVGDKNVEVFFNASRIQEIPLYAKYDQINTLFTSLSTEYLEGKRSLDSTMKLFDEKRLKIINDQ